MATSPTGKKITKDIIIDRFENGKVVEGWKEVNRVNLSQQLRVLPTHEKTFRKHQLILISGYFLKYF